MRNITKPKIHFGHKTVLSLVSPANKRSPLPFQASTVLNTKSDESISDEEEVKEPTRRSSALCIETEQTQSVSLVNLLSQDGKPTAAVADNSGKIETQIEVIKNNIEKDHFKLANLVRQEKSEKVVNERGLKSLMQITNSYVESHKNRKFRNYRQRIIKGEDLE